MALLDTFETTFLWLTVKMVVPLKITRVYIILGSVFPLSTAQNQENIIYVIP